MNSALKNHATYINNKVDTSEISLSQYISTDNILQNKQGIECATSLPIQGGKVTAFKKGDILLANIRPYLKKIWYAQFDGGCSADVLAIRANAETDSHFLFYALFRDDFFIHAMKGAKGTKMPRGDKAQIMEFKIPVFDLKTQQSIAAVLSALDKKIALNKQINTRLEEMAKTLYDYWFVQFDFPDANGKPYKSSGGEMVFDETLKREIPKGWEVKSLGEIASTSSGGTPTSTVQEYYKGGNIPWVNSGELNNNFIVHTDNFITQTGMDNSSAKLVSEKSILLAMYGATAGKTSLISFKTTTNQAICSILPKDMNYRVYIKSYLDNMYLYLVQLSSGSARDNLSQDKIKRLHLVIPESGILEIFSKVTEDFYKKIETNLKQNHYLTRLRNFLLPMLMNGQVSVAD